ncbi:LAMI_0C01970g1_1 [Lachancea mirantina]|uniref:LAMI_0C01970g1_1 n=1 Tax=Lachancea mirantina TaxID=1230905 RepID=A0A1G4J0X6_9SACH|nr:LAMI_0C01970g1_1 [Lachancea mirantina]
MSTQQERIEANRRRALERLKRRGLIRPDQARKIEDRNEKRPSKIRRELQPESDSQDVPVDLTLARVERAKKVAEKRTIAQERLESSESNLRDASGNENRAMQQSGKRPLDRIRPTIRREDYIEYDFATMKNSYGGFINVEETEDGWENKKQRSLEEWQREQKERRALYENAPPPEHPSLAPRCVECNINTELDPLLHDVFKLQICKTCAKNKPEKFALLTKTECKEDYFLTDPELNDSTLFYRLEKPNPHSGTFARMQLFVRCQIEEFAFKKWGGEEGLDKEWQRREEGKAQRREKKYIMKMKEMRKKTRAQEYTRNMLKRKHGEEHVHEFSAPIDGGVNEDGFRVTKRRCITCGLETEEIVI